MRTVVVFWFYVLAVLVVAVSAVTAQTPFVPGGSAPFPNPPTVSRPTTASGMLPMGNTIARQLPCLESMTENSPGTPSSSPQGTALETRPGTGSQSIIGQLTNPKATLTHDLSPELTTALGKLADAVKATSNGGLSVGISPTLSPETSQSLSPFANVLYWLGLLGGSHLAISLGGKLSALGARVVNGLRWLSTAASVASAAVSAAGTSSTPPNASPTANPAGQ